MGTSLNSTPRSIAWCAFHAVRDADRAMISSQVHAAAVSPLNLSISTNHSVLHSALLATSTTVRTAVDVTAAASSVLMSSKRAALTAKVR